MTSTLDRLADAMSAAAGTVREEELRPLGTPPARRRVLARGRRSPAGGRWRYRAWAAPVAAAAAVVLAIGLAVAASNGLSGTSRPAGPVNLPTAPHRFYLATDVSSGKTVVRSTATGKAVATVPVPSLQIDGKPVSPAVATAGNGTFYLAAFEHGRAGEQIYRFRLTGAGHVTGFARVPGGSLRPWWAADSLAVSPDGSLVAVGAYYYREHHLHGNLYTTPSRSEELVVVHTASGTQSIWRGGQPAPGYKYFALASLSWAANDRELAVLGEWCRASTGPGGEGCARRERMAQLRVIDPAGPGGSVLAGHLLLAQSPRLPYLAQALISPDGSVITVMVLHGQIVGNPQISGMFPEDLTVEQISAATGRQLGVLYQRRLGDTSEVSGPMSDPLTLIADATGRNLILDGGICNLHCSNEFNGWLRDGRLIPLPPTGFAHRESAEAW
jgi:hypothetical protein